MEPVHEPSRSRRSLRIRPILNAGGKRDFVQKDVRWLDIAMNDASRMHVQETTQDLVRNVSHVVDLKELVTCYYFIHVCFDEIHDNVPR